MTYDDHIYGVMALPLDPTDTAIIIGRFPTRNDAENVAYALNAQCEDLDPNGLGVMAPFVVWVED